MPPKKKPLTKSKTGDRPIKKTGPAKLGGSAKVKGSKTKGGASFKEHAGKAKGGASESKIGMAGAAKAVTASKKIVVNKNRALAIHNDTARSLPSFMQGRVKGLENGAPPAGGKLAPVGAKGRGALPKKDLKDKKGKRYATGKGGTEDGAPETVRRGSDDFSSQLDQMDRDDEIFRKSKRNPLAKFIQGRVRAFKRWMLLRAQAKTPVVLGDRAKAVTDALEMTQKHLKMMRAAFHEVDFSRMGNISYEEFFEFVDEPRSVFTDALYDQMIARATGQMMALDDFVISTLLYCNYSQSDLLHLIFNMFDKDGSGTIDEEEFVELCTMVNNGSPVFPGNFLRALEEFDTNDDGLIDFEEFTSLNNRYPIVLFPAFRLQQALQVHTLGEKEWTNIAGKVNQKRLAEIYARKHGGMPPPSFKTNLVYSDKFGNRLFRQVCCCLIPHLGVPLRGKYATGGDSKKKSSGGGAAASAAADKGV